MNKTATIVFGGGCFWCTEAGFNVLHGVVKVTSGYAGGEAKTANYEDVSTGRTEHAEVVKIEFDPRQIAVEDLLDVFFTIHDPTTLNRQGPDFGPQYRSVIFTTNQAQYKLAQQKIETQQQKLGLEKKMVTQLAPLAEFFEAETYHQRYFEKNPSVPYCTFLVAPKVEKIQQLFPHLLKREVVS